MFIMLALGAKNSPLALIFLEAVIDPEKLNDSLDKSHLSTPNIV